MTPHIIIEAPSKWEYLRIALALIGCMALGFATGRFTC